jgi:hypothetical protein
MLIREKRRPLRAFCHRMLLIIAAIRFTRAVISSSTSFFIGQLSQELHGAPACTIKTVLVTGLPCGGFNPEKLCRASQGSFASLLFCILKVRQKLSVRQTTLSVRASFARMILMRFKKARLKESLV